MSMQSLANRFVELCNQGKNFDVMREMYADDIVSVEAAGGETAGKTPVIQKSERWGAAQTVHGEKVLGPYFADATNAATSSSGQFAVHFSFDVTPKATGQRITLDEVGLYTVENGKITREQFFFAGSR